MAITFPNVHAPDPDTFAIAFPAKDGVKEIGCRISREALQDGFGDPHGDPDAIFRANRGAIEAIVERLISKGRFEQDGRIFIRSADVR